MSLVINHRFVKVPGIVTRNFLEDGEPEFKHTIRRKPLKHIVLHETAGRTAIGCKETLQKNGYGVHLILSRGGVLTCHGDLARHVMIHANQCNATSIGIEVVNPYAPRIAGKSRYDTIPARWWTWCPDRQDRRYVLPTQAQFEVLRVVVPLLCSELDIPDTFPTSDLNAKRRRITGWRRPPLGWRAKPKPGIVAHQDFSTHGDGRYLLEYLIDDQPQSSAAQSESGK